MGPSGVEDVVPEPARDRHILMRAPQLVASVPSLTCAFTKISSPAGSRATARRRHERMIRTIA